MTRFTSPPWIALVDATAPDDIIEVAPLIRHRRSWMGQTFEAQWDGRAFRVKAMEAIPKLARIEFDEDGNVWLAKD